MEALHIIINLHAMSPFASRNDPVNESNEDRYNRFQESLFEESIEQVDQEPTARGCLICQHII